MGKNTIFVFLWLCYVQAYGQVSIQLDLTSSMNNLEKSCYNIMVTNLADEAYELQGQNYRLYYDSRNILFNEQSIVSYLNESYTPLELKQHYFDIDASGFGPLEFESYLGFINIAVDYKNKIGGGHTLSPKSNLKVAKICFDLQSPESIPNIIWAKKEVTANYATAFVEMSLYNRETKKHASANFIELKGTKSIKVNELKHLDLDYYPNPFTTHFTLEYNHPLDSDGKVVTTDVFGKEVLVKEVFKGETQLQIATNNLPAGAYFFTINLANGYSATIKAIKV